MARSFFSKNNPKDINNMFRLDIFLAIATIVFLLSFSWIYIISFNSFSREGKKESAQYDLCRQFDIGVNNLQSDALDGIFSMPKVYVIPDTDTVAPAPDPSGYGTAESAEAMSAVLAKAEEYGLLSASDAVFVNDGARKTDISYYLDQSILAVMWKSSIDNQTYNFSEIFIAHPSQFRRYLTDNRFGSNKRDTASAMSEKLNAVVGMSADFYAYRQSGIVVYHGKLYRNSPSYLENCFIDKNGDLILTESKSTGSGEQLTQFINSNNINFSLSFGPILIKDGQLRNSLSHYRLGEVTDMYARAAIGQVGKLHYILCTVDGRVANHDGARPEDVGRQLYKFGCQNAYTLDGGQTATLCFNRKIFNRVGYGNERPISDIIFFATAVPSHTGEDQ